MTTLTAHILRMAGRTVGVRCDEVIGFPEQSVQTRCTKLCAEGRLHRAKIAHRHVRFFAHATMRDVFMEQVKLAQFQAKHPVQHGDIGKWGATTFPTGNAPWGADTPAHTPAHVKVQVCPAYRPRFEEVRHSFIHGIA